MTPGITHAAVPATKLGRGLWGQVKRRGAVRAALTDGAYSYAQQLGADHSEAAEFSRYVRQCLRGAGSQPTRPGTRALALFRGGPATIFDGPEARHWKERVERLGSQALAEFQRAHPDARWTTLAAGAEPSYPDAVLAAVAAQAAQDDRSPSLAILADQLRAEELVREEVRRTPTRVRIAKVVIVTALGAALGHYADVQSGGVPDWMETGIVATVAAAAGTRLTGQSSEQETAAEISAAAAESIAYSRRRLRIGLREVVNGLVEIVNPSLRGPPLAYQQPLTGTVEAGLVLVADQAKANSESTLLITGKQRETLADAMDRLRREADAAGLDELDPVCEEAITNLGRAVELLTDAPVKDYELQLQLGVEFVNALLLGWLVASRLEVTPAPSAEQLPQITDPPALKVAA